MGEEMVYCNHEDILKVIHEGYADEDNALMLENIADALSHTCHPSPRQKTA